MPRPQAVSNEEIIAAAEKLAQEIGLDRVYGATVRKALGRGSISTLTPIVKEWRAKKEAEQQPQPIQVMDDEQGADRRTAADEIIASVGEALLKIRQAFLGEIDRAVAEERRRSERVREDDKQAYAIAAEALRTRISDLEEGLSATADEAGQEAQRADELEDLRDVLLRDKEDMQAEIQRQLEVIQNQREQISTQNLKNIALDETNTSLMAQIADLKARLEKMEARSEKDQARADAAESKAEDAEQRAEAVKLDAEFRCVEAEGNAQMAIEAHAKACKATEDDLRASIEKMSAEHEAERQALSEKSDKAWSKVEDLTAQIATFQQAIANLQKEAPAGAARRKEATA